MKPATRGFDTASKTPAKQLTVREQRFSMWANIVMALAALGAIGVTVWQSSETTDVFDAARTAFTAQAFPVVKFSHYQWFQDPGGLSCERPATGINVYVRNFGQVPVLVQDMNLQVRMGSASIFPEKGKTEIGAKGRRILASGEITAFGRMDANFGQYYQRLLGASTQPLMTFCNLG